MNYGESEAGEIGYAVYSNFKVKFFVLADGSAEKRIVDDSGGEGEEVIRYSPGTYRRVWSHAAAGASLACGRGGQWIEPLEDERSN